MIVMTPPTTNLFSPPVIGLTSISFKILIEYFLVCLLIVNQKNNGKIDHKDITIEIITHIVVLSNGETFVLNNCGEFEYWIESNFSLN